MSELTTMPPVHAQWARLKGFATVAQEEARAEQESQEKCSWEEITNKPEKFTPSTHTHKLSEVTDYKEPDLSKYATINKLSSVKKELQEEIKTEVAGLVNGAPEALNTLKELGDAFAENANGVTEVLTQVGEVKASLADYALRSEIPTLPENHVTKDDLAEVAASIPSIEGLATETFVVEKIAETDHSIYATFEYVNEQVKDLASEDFVNEQILAVEKKIPTIPSHEEYALKTEVAESFEAVNSVIGNLESTSNNTYATKTELADEMVNVVKQIDITNDGNTYKTTQIGHKDTISITSSSNERHDVVSITKRNDFNLGSPNLHLNLNTRDTITINNDDTLATKSFVTSQIKAITIPDATNYATKGYVTDAVTEHDVKIQTTYAQKTYVDEKVAAVVVPDTTNFVTKDELVAAKSEIIVAASGDAAAKYATIETVEEIRAAIPSLPGNHVTTEELAAALFRINTLENRVSDLSKTNVTPVIAGNATSVTDETADLVIAASDTPIVANTTYVGKSIDVKSMGVESAKVVMTAKEGDLSVSDYVSSGAIEGSVVEVIANSGEHIKITNSVFGQSGYNAINIGNSSTTVDTAPKSILIDNVKFNGTLANNTINVYGQKDNAVITVSNCHFEGVSNPVRLFNVTNTSCTVNFINCTCSAWESDEHEIQYTGFLIMEEISSATIEEEAATNRFGKDKITVNFINCYGPHGKIVSGDPTTFCGVANENQLIYVFRHKTYNAEIALDNTNVAAGIIPYGDGSNYPVINIK